MRWLALLMCAGCFSPTVEEGAECSPEGQCPPGQTCAGDRRCYADSPSFTFRRRLDLHPLSLASVERDVPVAIILAGDEDLAAHARDDGLDIHFTEADGATELDFEVESFDGERGDLTAWVRIPLLSFEDTIFFYYGGEPHDRPEPAAVWHQRYLAVWHGGAGADPSVVTDSTGNASHGESGEEQAPARAGGIAGPALSFDGVDDQVLIDEAVPLVALTATTDIQVSLWVRVSESLADGDAAIGKGTQSGSTPGFAFQLGNSAWIVRLRGGGNGETMPAIFGDASALVGRWVMLGAAISHGDLGEEFFQVTASVDGEEVSSGYWVCQTAPCDLTLVGSLFLSHPDAPFKGLVDEIRIADRAAGVEDQRAVFENLDDPESFYTVGAEETLPL